MHCNDRRLSLVEEYAALKRQLTDDVAPAATHSKAEARLHELTRLLADMPANRVMSVQEKLWFAHCCTAKEVDFDAAIRLVNQVYPAFLEAAAAAHAGLTRKGSW